MRLTRAIQLPMLRFKTARPVCQLFSISARPLLAIDSLAGLRVARLFCNLWTMASAG
jgi:hypothetical protein